MEETLVNMSRQLQQRKK